MTEPRKVDGVYSGNGFHWVGDGFRVTQVFPGAHDLGERISPFILMDYHAPHEYEPTDTPRGVGVHPHRGIETVTLAFEGAVEHHDSTGSGGVINPGDAQWMTAGRAILHKEYHETEWAKTGGTMHMMQLWVNLPAASKMTPPTYQGLLAEDMGIVNLQDDSGTVRVIAGEYQGVEGPAHTHSPINLWDISLNEGGTADMSFPAHENAALFVLDGELHANGTIASKYSMILFDNVGSDIEISSSQGARALLLNGEPLGEPVVAHGPFVMNTVEEIVQAYDDFKAGEFGTLV